MKKIIIIGGGFAGINLARHLNTAQETEVTLVDRNNYNFFPPLLYQVATGFLEVSSISYPYRKLFRESKTLRFKLGEFVRVDAARRMVVLSSGSLVYDVLVFATGAQTNYFGNGNVRQNAVPMKTLNDALNLRNHFLRNLELAASSKNRSEVKKRLTTIIAGAGPTGVEVSGMLAEMKNSILKQEYPEILEMGIPSRIILVDGGTKVLAPMSERAQRYTHESLIKMGVEVRLGTQVKDYMNDMVTFSNGEQIETTTLVWAAGVSVSVLEGIPESCYGRGGRLLVNQFNGITGLEDIYAIGDTSLQVSDPGFPAGHPQLAQVAIQQGKRLARNLMLAMESKKMVPFQYHDKGSMAIIGRGKAVADLPSPKLHFTGFFAWAMWLFVHLLSLVKFSNKLRTFLNWTLAYLGGDQSLRMMIIIKPGAIEERKASN